jgi:hypothetical protein
MMGTNVTIPINASAVNISKNSSFRFGLLHYYDDTNTVFPEPLNAAQTYIGVTFITPITLNITTQVFHSFKPIGIGEPGKRVVNDMQGLIVMLKLHEFVKELEATAITETAEIAKPNTQLQERSAPIKVETPTPETKISDNAKLGIGIVAAAFAAGSFLGEEPTEH